MFTAIRTSIPHYISKSKPNLRINPIRVSENERSIAQLSRQNVQSGVQEFHRNGLVILENAVGHGTINHVRQRMLDDFHEHRHSPNVHWNQGKCSGNVSQTPPLLSEFLHEEIWANRFAVNIMEYIIGPKPQLSFATSNIIIPRTEGRQAVHSDYYCDHLDLPVFLEVSIYLQDVDSRNGSTEFWLGTHEGYSKKDHSSSTTGWIKRDVFTSRAAISPPIQPAIPKGSVCIRDLRCWHAGRENKTDMPRIILGFMYSPQWFGSHMRMKLPSAARKCLETWTHIDCLNTTEFVDNEFNYLEFNQDINLSQTPSDPYAPYVPKHGSGNVTPNDYWTPSMAADCGSSHRTLCGEMGFQNLVY
ncbi:hypothetical protein K432DRAFT_383470 [Lepidopterella palustris CBS 459.81]|uniref:Phytanoyl-CoA dioxygenase family protein n=1 Tax=Lepidopterella palustris CBS 459.81 TaxID=1314670 RepID=A0A8E2E801_9PEZI|nr:hypothetical protein K432DRAFT_383470 [Lepidopterella palustris CBS 459.81]